MATFHIDFINGNDANDGTTWALAWKTVETGASAARIAPGDEIRMAKTPEYSLGSCSWTNSSSTVTFSSSRTRTIYNANSSGSPWVGVNGTAANYTTSYKMGTAMTGFSNTSSSVGQVGYFNVSNLDLSSYNAISFWWLTTTTGSSLGNDSFRIQLMSGSGGAGSVLDEFIIPPSNTSSSANRVLYRTLTRVGGGNLSSGINSIVYYNVTGTIYTSYFNNIIACNTNDLCASGVIAKDSDKIYYPINAVDSDGSTTTITLGTNQPFTTTFGSYYGSTESTNSTFYFCLNTHATTDLGGSNFFVPNETGNLNARYTYRGGYNTTNSTVDGITGLSCMKEVSTGSTNVSSLFVISSSRRYHVFENLIFLRHGTGSINGFTQATSTSHVFRNVHFIQSGFCTVTFGNSGKDYYFENCSWGFSRTGFTSNVVPAVFYKCKFYRAFNANVTVGHTFIKCEIFGNNSGLLASPGHGDFEFFPRYVLINTKVDETTEFEAGASGVRSYTYLKNHDDVEGNHKIIADNAGICEWQTSVKQGSDPGSWKYSPVTISTNAGAPADNPFKMVLLEAVVSANNLVTVNIWCKKDHATNTQMQIKILNSDYTLPGISQTTTVKANDTNWEQLELTFTPTSAGTIFIIGEVWTTSGTSPAYFGSATITQA